jgi:hypothetical protein
MHSISHLSILWIAHCSRCRPDAADRMHLLLGGCALHVRHWPATAGLAPTCWGPHTYSALATRRCQRWVQRRADAQVPASRDQPSVRSAADRCRCCLLLPIPPAFARCARSHQRLRHPKAAGGRRFCWLSPQPQTPSVLQGLLCARSRAPAAWRPAQSWLLPRSRRACYTVSAPAPPVDACLAVHAHAKSAVRRPSRFHSSACTRQACHMTMCSTHKGLWVAASPRSVPIDNVKPPSTL